MLNISNPTDTNNLLHALPPGAHRLSCPRCGRGERDRTLSVTVGQDGALYYCFRCGAKGRVNIGQPSPLVRANRPVLSLAQLDWSARAEEIWGRALPIAGSPVETYLRSRGCVLPPSDGDLRCLPPKNEIMPHMMCALVSDVLTNKPLSLHFTKLKPDGSGKLGTDCDKFLLKGHRKKGGVIRLWPNDSVTTGLAIAEGIETALAAAHVFTPIWSMIDAGNLRDFPVLPGIEALTIFADHDAAGIAAANECAQRWADAGREVEIVTPKQAGHDFNDVVQK